MRTKDLTLAAVLSAVALGIFIAEAQIPPVVPIPGVKLGLANMITLTAMVLLGRKMAGCVLTVRILLGCMFAGGVSALLFSAAGGLCAYLAMCGTIGLFDRERQLWIVSIFGALAHNAGQLAVALLVTRTPGVLYYGFALAASAIVTGFFTGLTAQFLARSVKNRL